jgi:carbon monoxide dehydrogenase subunit G
VTFTQDCVIPIERDRLWDVLMDVPNVARCVPGVERVERVDGNAYTGQLKMQVGPIRLALDGTITIEEQDRSAWRARMRADASDRRLGGGLRARMSLTLTPRDDGTQLRVETDLAVLGKIGEFGQPIIRKKADAVLEEFARNLRSTL